MKRIKNIIFDFDGVIVESNKVKIDGFYLLFKHYGEEKGRLIADYFKNNAGLSRYDVFQYFYQNVIKETLSEKQITKLSGQYSHFVKDGVLKAEFVEGCREFLNKQSKYRFFLVSSTDEKDLTYFCNKLSIDYYFVEILGSPQKKSENIKRLVNQYGLNVDDTVYIGDSLNDYKATIKNGLIFIGRNSGLYQFDLLEGITVIDNLNNLDNVLMEI